VKRKTNERSLDAALERRWTKCSAGYELQQTNWTNAGPQPRSQTCCADVESSSDQPAPENWLKVHRLYSCLLERSGYRGVARIIRRIAFELQHRTRVRSVVEDETTGGALSQLSGDERRRIQTLRVFRELM